MIISHSKKFIFFKPIKVAGTSVEYSFWKNCNALSDVYTGSSLKSELSNTVDMTPVNNTGVFRVVDREEGIEYLKFHKKYRLLEGIAENKNIKNIKIYEPVCFEHTSPEMGKHLLEIYPTYKTISIVRNPYDMLVSYFWWAFNVEETIFSSFNENYKKNKRLASSLCPKTSDSISALREKISTFYSLPASFNNSYRHGNSDITVLEWVSTWQNEFYLFDMDHTIQYENLYDSYEKTISLLNLKPVKIEKFKTTQRKSNHHYSEYFNNRFSADVYELFRKSCKKFQYKKIGRFYE